MSCLLACSHEKILNFYSSLLNMLGTEHKKVSSVDDGLKLAMSDRTLINFIFVLNTKDELINLQRKKDMLDLNTQNIFSVMADDALFTSFNAKDIIPLSHTKFVTDTANIFSANGVCKPYGIKKEKKVDNVFDYIKKKLLTGDPSLPVNNDVSLRMLPMLNDEGVNIAKISDMTKSDPALHSGLLKMSNSIYYGGGTVSIKDINSAFVRLGINNIKTYLLSYINKSLSENKDLIFHQHIKNTVEETLSISAFCYILSDHFKLDKGVMFSIGMLHRIGYIFLLSTLSVFLKEQDLEDNVPKGYIDIAESNFIVTTTTLMKKWKFNPQFFMPVQDQNAPKTGSQYINESKALFLAKNFHQFFYKDEKKCIDTLKKRIGMDIKKTHIEKIKVQADEHLNTIRAIFN